MLGETVPRGFWSARFFNFCSTAYSLSTCCYSLQMTGSTMHFQDILDDGPFLFSWKQHPWALHWATSNRWIFKGVALFQNGGLLLQVDDVNFNGQRGWLNFIGSPVWWVSFLPPAAALVGTAGPFKLEWSIHIYTCELSSSFILVSVLNSSGQNWSKRADPRFYGFGGLEGFLEAKMSQVFC